MNAIKTMACMGVMYMALMAMSAEAVDMTNAVPVQAKVPPPSETPAKIIVSGRTSTAIDIKIVKAGQEIPKTYAGNNIHNTTGFEFYVSEHFALKSSKDEAFSRMMLEVSELAYAQCVAMLGAEPPHHDTRLYLVYARDGKELCKAMNDDIGSDPGGFLGGFATYANRSAYNLPGGGLMYHLRGLTIHENLHAMVMVVTDGKQSGEGITYAVEHHVYDPDKKQLTVFCFDKVPINNYTSDGLFELRKEFVPMQEAVKRFWYGGGGAASVYQFFFFTDPDRFLKWRIWRDEFFTPDSVTAENNAKIMEDIFGPLDKLNEDWKKWVGERQTTFQFRTWAFEQHGAWLWSRPSRHDDYTRTDVNIIPGEIPRPDPLRMDYPRNPPPATVGPIRRGPKDPAIGCELDLSKHPDVGRVGMAFGVEDEGSATGSVKVVIEDGRRLVIDAAVWQQKDHVVELPESFRAAVAGDGHRLGMTVTFKTNSMNVVLRAKVTAKGEMESFTADFPLTPAQSERLLKRKMSLLSKLQEGEYFDLQFGIQPFFDDLPLEEIDLTKPAAPNRWRFDGLDRLETLYRAAWRLKDKAPQSLLQLKADMLAAVDNDRDAQVKAVADYEARIAGVVKAVKECGADPKTVTMALGELAGLNMSFNVRAGGMPSKIRLETQLNDRLDGETTGKLTFSLESSNTNLFVATHELGALGKRIQIFTEEAQVADTSRPLVCKASAVLKWRGETISVTQTQLIFNSSVPVWWTIGPFNNNGGGTVDTPQAPEKGAVVLTNTYTGAGGKSISWQKAERQAVLGYFDDFKLDYSKRYGGQNVSAFAVTWIVSPKAQDAVLAIGSDDGVAVWLNGSKVHTNLMVRGYSPMQDRVPISLKEGRNELLVKVTQGDGGWCMGAHLLNKESGPLTNVTYELK